MSRAFQLSELNSIELPDSTCFIGFHSFETRSVSIIDNLPTHDLSKILFFRTTECLDLTTTNALSLSERFADKYQEILIDSDMPLGIADQILDGISSLCRSFYKPNLLIDITTFTRESLLILVKIIHYNRSKISEVKFMYSPAQGMSRDWLSKGFDEIRTVVGYPGDFKPSDPLHLMVIAGFEIERARQIIYSYDPELITIAYGKLEESVNRDFFELNKKFALELRSCFGYKVAEPLEIPLLNPEKIAKTINTHISKFPSYNTTISPLNNKITTLGTALAAIADPSIQLCYCRARIYNHEAYSVPSATCYLIENIIW